ncbi:MAG: hypoxia response transcriptional regulator [Acidimicrobiia bacterium]|nr:MAG: hypoxia response transcriptional regulator [Acidimicrobiia bacterium]
MKESAHGSSGCVMRIGEIGHAVGVDPPTIRYYESVGVLPEPERTSSGYREYSGPDVERLRFVTLARSLGLGLDDIRDILALRDRGEAPCGYVRGVLDQQVDAVAERISQLQALSEELRRLQAVAGSLPDIGADDPCVCHILQPAGTIDHAEN